MCKQQRHCGCNCFDCVLPLSYDTEAALQESQLPLPIHLPRQPRPAPKEATEKREPTA